MTSQANPNARSNLLHSSSTHTAPRVSLRHMSTSAERMRRMRARQATRLLPPDGGPPIRSADELLLPAVKTTLAALELDEAGAGVAQLARGYARAMDQARDPAWAARWIGPLLLDALASLGATPMARARMKPHQKPSDSLPSRLDALREAHTRRRL